MKYEHSLEATPEAAVSRLTLLVFRLNGLILAAGDRLAAPAGQTSARWQVMGVIDHEPLTVAEVARRMGLRRQSVLRTAGVLVASGAATYVDNPDDRRARLLTLTPAGRRSLRAIENAQQVWAREVGDAVGLASVLDAERALARFIEVLEASGRGGPGPRGGAAGAASAAAGGAPAGRPAARR